MFKAPTANGESPLRSFTGLPQRCLSILGPRRIPRVQTPAQSTDNSIAVSTSVGFSKLDLKDYNDATDRLKADVVVSLADIADADRISMKRMERMADRTHAWLRDTVKARRSGHVTDELFATVLPLEAEEQQLYLSDLEDDYRPDLQGLVLHHPQSAPIIPQQIQHLPRFCVYDPPNPSSVLHAISRGVDLITTPFVTATTEQGIAFTFTFPAPSAAGQEQLSLGADMWSTENASDVSPLAPDCTCYTCSRHHRAYLHHLLQAKEMLAWTLLQIHNFHIMDQFFSAIRSSVKADAFTADAAAFKDRYEEEFLVGEGKKRGPRIRGYQMKSVGRGGDPKKEKAWGRFRDSNVTSGSQSPSVVGVENDQARKVVEAIESGVAVGQAQDQGDVNASVLGVAERQNKHNNEDHPN